MKILHLGKYYHPYTGGIETVTKDICEGMVSKGHEVTVLCSNDKNKSEEKNINGVNVIYSSRLLVLLSQPINLFLALTLYRSVKNFDVVHVHSPNPFAELISLFIPKKIKVVTTHHADVERQKIFLKFYKHLYNAFLKRCDKIYVATENHIKYSKFLPAFKDKCEVIPFTIDESRFNKNSKVEAHIKELREKHGDYALFVGRLVSYKGLDYLVEAAKTTNGKILIVGGGPDQEKLEQKVFDSRIENVVFLGKVLDEDYFSALYHASNFMVLPSTTHAENFGVVQLEAMYCRKPMITTRIDSGVPLVGKHNETSFIIPPKDSEALSRTMNILFENQELVRQMGLNAMKRFFKLYTKNIFNKSHDESYRALLEDTSESEEFKIAA